MAKKRRTKLGDIFFGPKALMLPQEEPSDYVHFYMRLRGALEPTDIIEEIWVRDVADLSWGVLQFRRLRASRLAELYNLGATPGSHPNFYSLMRSIEGVEALTAAAERRRNDALWEIERRREAFAHRARQSIKQIESNTQLKANANTHHSNDNAKATDVVPLEPIDPGDNHADAGGSAAPHVDNALQNALSVESDVPETVDEAAEVTKDDARERMDLGEEDAA